MHYSIQTVEISTSVQFKCCTPLIHNSNQTPVSFHEIFLYQIFFQFVLSVIGALGLHIGSAVVQPPKRYPDLWPVLISLYSCAHFLAFLCYFNYIQFTIPYTLQSIVTKEKKS